MIFCVEDDESIRDLMLYTLTAAGFTAEGFSHSKPFWEAMRGRRPQLILLDIMHPCPTRVPFFSIPLWNAFPKKKAGNRNLRSTR